MLWTGTQAGVTVRGGSFSASLGSGAGLPKNVLDRKESWLAVSVRGPDEAGFTALVPRQLLPTAGTAELIPLSCPHNHFGASWFNSTLLYGLRIWNMGDSIGLQVWNNGIDWWDAAVVAENRSPGGGAGVFGRSENGLGGYFESGKANGLQATTLSPYSKWA